MSEHSLSQNSLPFPILLHKDSEQLNIACSIQACKFYYVPYSSNPFEQVIWKDEKSFVYFVQQHTGVMYILTRYYQDSMHPSNVQHNQTFDQDDMQQAIVNRDQQYMIEHVIILSNSLDEQVRDLQLLHILQEKVIEYGQEVIQCCNVLPTYICYYCQ